jgi:8-amino-3,8-dideoxy-alpha-D-manno-octulosonate transaminase
MNEKKVNDLIPPDFPGAVMFDETEAQSVLEVIRACSPFRYYGPNLLNKVKTFEIEFARMVGVPYCVAVSSGTAALIVALRALGIGPGDEVIIPAHAFIACVEAVVLCGATPVFAEIDESLTLDPADLENKITSQTKVIMPVHIEGAACAMDRILSIARARGVQVLEDCAQACGAKYGNRRVGSLGHIGAFSFQINKTITTGEGGAVTTSDFYLYNRAVRAHDHGTTRDNHGRLVLIDANETFVSENYRMSELAGALGLAQLAKLEIIINSMRKVKKAIKDGLGKLQHFEFRKIWDESGETGRRLILIAEAPALAKGLANKLAEQGFAAEVPYGGRPVYEHCQIRQMRMWYGKEVKAGDGIRCPRSEDLLSRTVMIGLNPKFTSTHVEQLIRAVKEFDFNPKGGDM